MTIMNKMAASSCSTDRLNLRPHTFSRQMLRGTTGRQESRTVRGVDVDLQVDSDAAGLTGHLPQAADEQRLVVAACKGDAVATSVLLLVLDLMFTVGVRHTQQVLLQQLRAAQDRTVVGEGRHEPERHRLGLHLNLLYADDTHLSTAV